MKQITKWLIILILTMSFLKAEDYYKISANELLDSINSVETKDKDLENSLLMLNVIKKDDIGKFTFNNLQEIKFLNKLVDWIEISGLDKVAYTKDNQIVVTGSMESRFGFVFYFSKDYVLKDIVVIKHPPR